MTDRVSTAWWRRLSRLLLVAGLLLVLAAGALKLVRLGRLARSLQAHLETARDLSATDWKGMDLRQARELVHGVREDFGALKSELEPWLWLAPAFRWVPVYGSDATVAAPLLEMGEAGIEAAALVTDSLLPFLEVLQGDTRSVPALISDLSDAQPALVAVEAELQRLAAVRATIPPGDYSPLLTKLLDRLDQYLPLAQAGLSAAQLVPGVLEVGGTRSYLIIAQNEDEIRPTGGFISSAGLLTVEGGEVVALVFLDSYAVDDWFHRPYPELPDPFRAIMGDGIWLFRDANWSPDWPTSARQAIKLYQIGRDVAIDGVIALDQRAVRLLVGPLGPLPVGGGLELVTAESVGTFMRQAWISPAEGEAEDWWRYRKAFIGALAASMQRKLLDDLGSVDLTALAAAASIALDEKHILLYFQDPALQGLVRQAGWDGSVRTSPGDYLMVVDANMGFNKVAPAIRQRIDYRVSLGEPARPRAQVTLIYTHTGKPRDEACQHQPTYDSSLSGYADLVDRCYWDYVRVYPPAGAVPTAGSQHPVPGDALTSGRDWPGQMVVAEEPVPEHGNQGAGRLSLANLLLLRWGESQAVRFEYRLPPTVVDRSPEGVSRYRLLVQKQPGTDAPPTRVVVSLPSGAELLRTTPASSRSGDDVLFELVLRVDQEITVEWTNG